MADMADNLIVVKKQKLTLSISQIAPLIGLDNYNNFARIFCDIWRKYKPNEFREYEIRLKMEGNKLANANEMNDIWEIDEALGTNIMTQIKELTSNKDKTSGDLVKLQDEIAMYINKQENLSGLDKLQKDDLIKKVCSITNKSHGINNENAILTEFCRLSEKVLQQEQGWVEIPLITSNLIEWIIIGKYDGITTDNELVEAKMRQKCLFKKVRDYENIQVQLYLHGLAFQKGYLIEAFTNKTSNKKDAKSSSSNVMKLGVHEIQYDKEYVCEIILERLKQFAKFFETIMLDENQKMNLLKGDVNRSIYKIYEIDYLGIF